MELINKPMQEQEQEKKRTDLEIKQLKEIVRVQSREIEELKNDISILVGVFKKYDEVFSSQIEGFSLQAKKINLAVDEVKAGVRAGAKEGTSEVIEGATKEALNKSLREIDAKSKAIINNVQKAGDKVSEGILLSNVINNLSVGVVAGIIIIGLLGVWQFIGLRNDTRERLEHMEYIQQRLTDLTIGDGKYWYSERDKKAYYGHKEEIKKAKEQEKKSR